VAAGIVDALEIVDINEQGSEIPAPLLGRRKLSSEALVQVASIENTRQTVPAARVLKLLRASGETA